ILISLILPDLVVRNAACAPWRSLPDGAKPRYRVMVPPPISVSPKSQLSLATLWPKWRFSPYRRVTQDTNQAAVTRLSSSVYVAIAGASRTHPPPHCLSARIASRARPMARPHSQRFIAARAHPAHRDRRRSSSNTLGFTPSRVTAIVAA